MLHGLVVTGAAQRLHEVAHLGGGGNAGAAQQGEECDVGRAGRSHRCGPGALAEAVQAARPPSSSAGRAPPRAHRRRARPDAARPRLPSSNARRPAGAPQLDHPEFLQVAGPNTGRDLGGCCWRRVGRGGVEPPTFRFSGGRSYRLSYLPATPTGLEPATSAVTGRRANQLRYGARHGRADRGMTVPDQAPRFRRGTSGERAGDRGRHAADAAPAGRRTARCRCRARRAPRFRCGSGRVGEGQAAGAGAGGGVAVVGVGEAAAVQREAAAADAVGEVVA